jgi:rhodanese-related sulfurtransferase
MTGTPGATHPVRYHFTFPLTVPSPPMSFIQSNWLLILVMFLSGAMLIWPYVQRLMSPVQEIGTLNVTQLINSRNAVLLDIREPKEFEGGRVPNAIHIPAGQLASRSQELGKLVSRPIVVYSERGGRSRTADAALGKQGFKDIYYLNGGFAAWKAAGLPVEK